MRRGPRAALVGTVVHGRANGRKVGMPTANLKPDPGQQMPPSGVYATLTRVDGALTPGVTNVGLRPSVDDDPTPTVETYLIGFAGDLYGRRLTVSFYDWLRPVQKFDSLEAVKRQVAEDARRARALLEDERERGDAP